MKVDSFFTASFLFFRKGNNEMKTQAKCTNHGLNPKNSEKINIISGMACKLDFVFVLKFDVKQPSVVDGRFF